MIQLCSYLSFNGNCLPAMKYYQKVLGGRLQIQTLGQSPLTKKMDKAMKRKIVQASLQGNGFVIIGSDLTEDTGLNKGNGVSLFLQIKTKARAEKIFGQLAKGGIAKQELQTTHWGSHFGTLEDKYGNYWVIHCNPPIKK